MRRRRPQLLQKDQVVGIGRPALGRQSRCGCSLPLVVQVPDFNPNRQQQERRSADCPFLARRHTRVSSSSQMRFVKIQPRLWQGVASPLAPARHRSILDCISDSAESPSTRRNAGFQRRQADPVTIIDPMPPITTARTAPHHAAVTPSQSHKLIRSTHKQPVGRTHASAHLRRRRQLQHARPRMPHSPCRWRRQSPAPAAVHIVRETPNTTVATPYTPTQNSISLPASRLIGLTVITSDTISAPSDGIASSWRAAAPGAGCRSHRSAVAPSRQPPRTGQRDRPQQHLGLPHIPEPGQHCLQVERVLHHPVEAWCAWRPPAPDTQPASSA